MRSATTKRHNTRMESVLLQLSQHLLNIPLIRQPINNLQFRQFNIDRIVVLAKEDFDVVL